MNHKYNTIYNNNNNSVLFIKIIYFPSQFILFQVSKYAAHAKFTYASILGQPEGMNEFSPIISVRGDREG